MYTREEQKQAAKQTRNRLLFSFVPAALLIVAAIVLFVLGPLDRTDDAWKLPALLTLVGGVYAIFFYGVLAKPMRSYSQHINYMLDGRLRETTGYLIDFSENPSERNGIECRAIMLNVGEKDDREDDRLFYYDAKKLPLPFEMGTKVTVTSNDMLVSAMREAE